MAIPYLLIGNIQEDGTYLRKSATHFETLNVKQINARAQRVDGAGKQVHLSNGEVLAFDKLLIATGSRPVQPPIPGIDSPEVQTCWTLEDARAIMELAKPGARVVQMGAGFIGCIIMEALAARGVELTVVEMGDRMVPRMMGPVAGGMIREWVQHKGVQVFTGAKVTSIERKGESSGGLLSKLTGLLGGGSQDVSDAPLTVVLSNGKKIPADLVISATGVKPCIDFLEGSDVKCLQGVLTDEHLQTNVPGVYAAGDCAEAFDKVSGKTIVSAIQPNAAEQARVAALNMVGQTTYLKGVTQINVLDTLGLISTSFGNWEGVSGGESATLTTDNRHLSLQFSGDVMVGCNSVGWTDHVGVMRGLVEGQVHLGEWKDKLIEDPTQLMRAYLARSQAQSEWSGANDTRRR